MSIAPLHSQRPELWAGIECTINRVQDKFNDQMECSGHANRVSDIDLFAELGIQTMRYPILWERTAPDEQFENICWSWADERLEHLRKRGIRPIVGLLHHGSGPRHTSLVSPSFPEALAQYAGQVSQRFPWVEDWTPINEPLTTARFSGLYGHWYPHGRDERTFTRALIQQCRAIALSMQAIRKVNSNARLIQTDDLGKVYSTPRLQYQADFENERRWLGWDLLCGLVDRYHRMWKHLRASGILERELEWFLDNPCPPGIIGINHYLTSERFIDERLERYPPHSYGDNGRDRYVDVEAVRVLPQGTLGTHGILQEAWQRYQRPLAITEVHLGCTREEQMRWLMEAWESACSLRQSGIDIHAVTAWALLGSYDWNSLLTHFEGHYEPGAFDLRGGYPRPTAIAHQLRQIAQGEKPTHPVLGAAGWWRRPQRILYPVGKTLSSPSTPLLADNLRFHKEPSRPILITGVKGTLGSAFARLCQDRNLIHVALTRHELDIADAASVEAALRRYEPWAIINAAGYTNVESAQHEEVRCLRENTAGPALLATVCARQGIALLTFSSDRVFNGRQTRPYIESDPCTPLGVLGRSKVKAEQSVLKIMPAALMVRTSALFGPWDHHNFITRTLEQISAGMEFEALDNVTVSPTYIPDLVNACLDLLIDGESGIWHLTNQGEVTWKCFAQMAAERAGLDETRINGGRLPSLRLTTHRPRYSVLGSERGQLLQSLEGALECYIKECGPSWSANQIEREHIPRQDTHHTKSVRIAGMRERADLPGRHPLKKG